MKTLDDALSTPGGIPYGTYSLSDLSPVGVSGYIGSESGISVAIKGVFHFSELRRIADHLDPPASVPEKPDSSPVIPEGWALVPKQFDGWPEYHYDGMGCGLEDRGIRDRYEAMLYGWEQAIERLGEQINGHLESDYDKPLRTEAEVRAEARREALEEAAKVAEALANNAGGDYEYGGALEACEQIRALIEREPGNG